MINWNDIKNFDIADLDLTNLDLSKLDPRNMDLPTFDLPNFELPEFELPKFDVATDVDKLANLMRDAAYAGVGAVVVAAQKADEQRRELTDQVTANVRKLVDAVA